MSSVRSTRVKSTSRGERRTLQMGSRGEILGHKLLPANKPDVCPWRGPPRSSCRSFPPTVAPSVALPREALCAPLRSSFDDGASSARSCRGPASLPRSAGRAPARGAPRRCGPHPGRPRPRRRSVRQAPSDDRSFLLPSPPWQTRRLSPTGCVCGAEGIRSPPRVGRADTGSSILARPLVAGPADRTARSHSQLPIDAGMMRELRHRFTAYAFDTAARQLSHTKAPWPQISGEGRCAAPRRAALL